MSFYQEKVPVSLRVAQTVGITASMYLFGQNASASYMAIPAIMDASAPVAVKQWYRMFKTGMSVGPLLALVSALATGYTAYHQDTKSLPFKLNLAATLLFPSIVPFTAVFMAPMNNKLLEKRDSLAMIAAEDKSAEAGVAQEETVHALLDKWAGLNLARSMLVGVGSILAIWGSLSKLEVIAFSEIGLKSGANRLR